MSYIPSAFSVLANNLWTGNNTINLTANGVITTGRRTLGMLHVVNTGTFTLMVNGTNIPINASTVNSGLTTLYYYVALSTVYVIDKSGNTIATASSVPDTVAPTISSRIAHTATTITVVFDEPVSGTTAGWSFNNGSALTISSRSGSGTDTWVFTVVQTMTTTDTITYAYVASSGNVVDLSSNVLASASGSVTNMVPAGFTFVDADLTGLQTWANHGPTEPTIWYDTNNSVNPYLANQPLAPKLPSGQDGALIIHNAARVGSALNTQCFITTTSQPTVGKASGVAVVECAGWGNMTIYDGVGAGYVDTGTLDADWWLGLFRIGSVWTARKSSDKVNWTIVHTFATTVTGDVWGHFEAYGGPRLHDPQTTNNFV